MTDDGVRIQARYFPEIFNVADEKRAREIILTSEGEGADSATRWALETPYLIELIRSALRLRSDTIVLGCGIGRLAKAMIDATGCSVIGLDTSPSMRKLAQDYVGSDRFIVASPAQLDALVTAGLRVHAAIAVWVLQHCFSPADEIARIRRSLAAEGHCWVLNMPKQKIPVVREGMELRDGFCWASDGIDVAALLRAEFDVVAAGEPDNSRVPNMGDADAYWMSLRARGS
jgi:SAM-dependent methyltransferase